MTTRAQFRLRAGEMWADAQVLLAHDSASNAFYLAGYAVETALKAVIARRFVAEDVPDRRLVADIHTHDLNSLLAIADLQTVLRGGSAALKARWSTVEVWNERSRYRSAARPEAARLLEAVGSPIEGVLPWLTNYW